MLGDFSPARMEGGRIVSGGDCEPILTNPKNYFQKPGDDTRNISESLLGNSSFSVEKITGNPSVSLPKFF